MGIGDCYSEKDEREARNLARDRGQAPRGQIQMDSAREFADFLIWKSGAISCGSRNPERAAEVIASRDSDLWRMAQEQMREKAASHVPWSDGKCSCGIKYSASNSMTPFEDWHNHIRSLPLDPLPAGDAAEVRDGR